MSMCRILMALSPDPLVVFPEVLHYLLAVDLELDRCACFEAEDESARDTYNDSKGERSFCDKAGLKQC